MAKTFIGNIKGPKGDKGDKGDPGTGSGSGTAATISIGSVTTGAAGSSASVTNSGTTSAAVLDFVIPKGDKGEKGDKGDTGATGAQGVQGVKGDTGATGAAGTAATISIGTVTTGAAGTSASVTNVGTSTNAKLNFVIPKGDKGDTGDGASVNIIDNLTSTLVNAALSANQGKVLKNLFYDGIIVEIKSGDINDADSTTNITYGYRYYAYIKNTITPLLIVWGSYEANIENITPIESKLGYVMRTIFIDYGIKNESARAFFTPSTTFSQGTRDDYTINVEANSNSQQEGIYWGYDKSIPVNFIGVKEQSKIEGHFLVFGIANAETVQKFGG